MKYTELPPGGAGILNCGFCPPGAGVPWVAMPGQELAGLVMPG